MYVVSFSLWLVKGVHGRFAAYFDRLTSFVTKCETVGMWNWGKLRSITGVFSFVRKEV
jgi:hypothetical protein